ncbi:MAG: hypothetical protein GX790_03445, partial [Syntrophomonadaceae bacterium]|nr:hypothetical protein [Syntrophomonadaceae bacterium]
MKKKIISIGVCLVIIFSLLGCGVSPDASSNSMPEKAEILPPANVSKMGEPMTQDEIAYYLAKIEANLTVERTGHELSPSELQAFREFAEA